MAFGMWSARHDYNPILAVIPENAHLCTLTQTIIVTSNTPWVPGSKLHHRQVNLWPPGQDKTSSPPYNFKKEEENAGSNTFIGFPLKVLGYF